MSENDEFIIKRNINELKNDLKTLKVARILCDDEDKAICIKIPMGGDNFLEYWVHVNKHVLNLIDEENKVVLNELYGETSKLDVAKFSKPAPPFPQDRILREGDQPAPPKQK